MTLFKAMIPEAGVVALFAGVHLVRWRREWGEPKLLFAEAEGADLLEDERVKALVEECRWWLEEGRFLAGNASRKQAGVERTLAALAPFKEAEADG